MRHNKKINHLGRTSSHRGAMLSNMAASLIMHKRIFTTVPKAKALKKVVEPIITKSKDDTTHSRRLVFRTLQNKVALTELFQNVSQKVGDRPGGYTRIIRTGHRLGDNASMCFIELVDYNENMLKDSTAGKKTRTRRSRRKADDTDTITDPKTTKAVKTPKADVLEDVKVEEKKPKADVSEDVKVEEEKPTTEQQDTNEEAKKDNE